MALELKNLQTEATFEIEREATVGREGGGAQISVPDLAVSKKHARFFTDGTTWFVEDLGSMNGTSVNGRRLEAPEALTVGAVVALSKHKLEVLSLGRRAAPRPAATPEPSRQQPVPGQSEQRRRPARETNRSEQAYAADDIAPPMSQDSRLNMRNGRSEPQPEPQDQSSMEPRYSSAPSDVSPGQAIGAAIGYYAATMPLLALNPPGTVRKSIDDQRVEPMEKMSLGLFFLPAYVASGLLTAVAGAVASLVAGGGLPIVSMILTPVIMAVVAIVGGFLFHPILNWVIDKLGGQSDERSRTNYGAIGAAAVALVMVPSALSTLFMAIVGKLSASFAPISLLMIIPVLVAVVAQALVGFVGWKWMQYFQVAKWFQTLMLVLAILGAVGALAGGVSTIKAAFAGMSGGGGAAGLPSGVSGDAAAALAAAQKQAEEAAIKAGLDPAAAKAQVEAAQKAIEAAAKAGGDVKAGVVAGVGAGVATPTTDKPSDKPADVKPTTPTTPDKPSTPADEPVQGKGAYGDWLNKRRAVERALEEDPTVLAKSRELNEAYKEFSKLVAEARDEVEEKVLDKKTSRGEMKIYLDKAVAAKEFEKTQAVVNKLYKLLKL
jgi:hypothetical protein